MDIPSWGAAPFSRDLAPDPATYEKLSALYNQTAAGPGSLSPGQTSWEESFTYDTRGNRKGKSNGWGLIRYTCDEENRMTKAGKTGFTYDAKGNMTGRSLMARVRADYGYNSAGRLISVESPVPGFLGTGEKSLTGRLSFTYDVFGRRNTRTSGGETTATVYDAFSVTAAGKTKQTGSFTYEPLASYTIGDGRIVAETDLTDNVNSPAFYHHDALGSTAGISGMAGESTYSYDAFGLPLSGDFTDTPDFLFTGKPYDPSIGLMNYGYRDYMPGAGRFMTADPIRDGFNWYAYVYGDPVNFVDPLGLCGERTYAGFVAYKTRPFDIAATIHRAS